MTTDAALLHRYATTRDAIAFAELAKRYRAMVFAVGRRTTGNHHDAEDVVQGCFMDLARHAGQIVNGQCLAGWLHSAATRRAIRTSQSKRRQVQIEQQASAERREAAADPDWAELSPLIDAAIAEMSPEQRDPLVLYFFQERTQAEIAAELNSSRTAIARRIEKGIAQLRKKIGRSGVVASAAVLTLMLKQNAFASTVPATVQSGLARMALYGPPVASTPRSLPMKKTAVAVGGVLCRHAIAATLALAFAGGGAAYWWMNQSLAPRTYDRLQRSYATQSPEGFARRIAMMSQNAESYWRGSQPLFFEWCRQNAADWLVGGPAVLSPATPLLADALTLPAEIDVQNSATLPFQVELLQAMVSARIELNLARDPARLDVDRDLFTAYRQALTSNVTTVASPIAEAADAGELARYVNSAAHFRPIVQTVKGKIAEVLLPIQDRPGVGRAVREALQNNARLLPAQSRDAEAVNTAIVDVAERIRFNAVASQGTTSIIVSLRGGSSLQLLELHEASPAAAEAAGAIVIDPRSPGRRMAEDEMQLATGSPRSWCTLGGRSMYARLHEMPIDTARNGGLALAKQWGATIGSVHRAHCDTNSIAIAMNDELLAELSRRADAFTDRFTTEFEDLRDDRRRDSACAQAESEATRWVSDALKAASQQ